MRRERLRRSSSAIVVEREPPPVSSEWALGLLRGVRSGGGGGEVVWEWLETVTEGVVGRNMAAWLLQGQQQSRFELAALPEV